jgi:PAS domain S-box-containing protein
MGWTTGFLTSSLLLLLLGAAVWQLVRQRQDSLFQAKVIAATSCSVVVTDATTPRHPVIYVNPAFLLLTGYAESDILGQTTAILAGPDTDRASVEKLRLALQDGRACRVRLLCYRKNGTSFLNEVALSPVTNRAGRLTSVIWVMSDVTQCRQAEENRNREAIGALAGGIAHELNNSLTAVLCFSQLALPLIPTNNKAHRHVEQVIVAGRKSRELVHQLLTFSNSTRRPACVVDDATGRPPAEPRLHDESPAPLMEESDAVSPGH